MTSSPIIFLDNNSTTQVLPEVVEAMLPYWTERYLNPSSVAGEVTGSATPIRDAKQVLCEVLNATDPCEFALTSGATEANNWVLQSVVARHHRAGGNIHLIVSEIEHPSVLESASVAVQDSVAELSHIPVRSDGVIDTEALLSLVRPETKLVSVMLANNETGVIQPVGEIARRVKDAHPRCLIHTDATQAVGKIPVNLSGELDAVDFLSLSAHKFHGPKGIGALFIRHGQTLEPLLRGGSQQEGLRAGTENSPLAAGMAAALRIVANDMPEKSSRITLLRDMVEETLNREGIKILGLGALRLPNTTFAIFPDIEGEMLVHLLAEEGIATSTASACSHGSDHPSHVAIAMGIDYESAKNTLRVSLSRLTDEHDIDAFIKILIQVISTQRSK